MSQALKKCPRDKILNPKSGRCVKKDGKIGKELIMKAKKAKKAKSKKPKEPKSKKKCTAEKIAKCTEEDKICNPETGRCVMKDGKIGKKILAAKKLIKAKKPAKKKPAKKSAKKKPAKKSKKPDASAKLTYKNMIIQNNETLKSYKSRKGNFTIEATYSNEEVWPPIPIDVSIDIENNVSVKGKNLCEMILAKFPGTFGKEGKDYQMKVSLDEDKKTLNIHVSGGITCTQQVRSTGGTTLRDVDDKLDFLVILYLTGADYKTVSRILTRTFEI